ARTSWRRARRITDSAWSGLSACVGAPFCGRAQIDTTAIADLLAHSAVFAADGCSTPVHVSGCDRRCGAPAGDHLDLVAPSPEEALASVGAGVLSRMSRR
ncbi:MAG: hypothetical protein L0H24_03135, partial [Microlunatus sp.]|nr:hypothetical protein [Microlunatus sp.]